MTSRHASTKISGNVSKRTSAGLLHTIAAHVRAHIERQRLLREHDRVRSNLLTLSDHLLKDIGLARDQITYAAGRWSGFDRQTVTTGPAIKNEADQAAVSGEFCSSLKLEPAGQAYADSMPIGFGCSACHEPYR
jgi:uncharacterized protein YjiS (DUF1127 family)